MAPTNLLQQPADKAFTLLLGLSLEKKRLCLHVDAADGGVAGVNLDTDKEENRGS